MPKWTTTMGRRAPQPKEQKKPAHLPAAPAPEVGEDSPSQLAMPQCHTPSGRCGSAKGMRGRHPTASRAAIQQGIDEFQADRNDRPDPGNWASRIEDAPHRNPSHDF